MEDKEVKRIAAPTSPGVGGEGREREGGDKGMREERGGGEVAVRVQAGRGDQARGEGCAEGRGKGRRRRRRGARGLSAVAIQQLGQ